MLPAYTASNSHVACSTRFAELTLNLLDSLSLQTSSKVHSHLVLYGVAFLTSDACVLQGFGVIGGSAEGPQEVEGGEAALSLTLGVLPGVGSKKTALRLHPLCLTSCPS